MFSRELTLGGHTRTSWSAHCSRVVGRFAWSRTAIWCGVRAISTGTAWSAPSARSSARCRSWKQQGWRTIVSRHGGVGSVDEPVAEADDGLDLRPGGAELRAQPSHVHVDRSRLDEAIVAPHAFQQPIARQDAVPVFHEKLQQLELTSRQADGLPVDRDGDRVEVRTQVGSLRTRPAPVRRRCACAAAPREPWQPARAD